MKCIRYELTAEQLAHGITFVKAWCNALNTKFSQAIGTRLEDVFKGEVFVYEAIDLPLPSMSYAASYQGGKAFYEAITERQWPASITVALASFMRDLFREGEGLVVLDDLFPDAPSSGLRGLIAAHIRQDPNGSYLLITPHDTDVETIDSVVREAEKVTMLGVYTRASLHTAAQNSGNFLEQVIGSATCIMTSVFDQEGYLVLWIK